MMSDYLKEGETPEECVVRNRRDCNTVLSLLADEKKKVERIRMALREELLLKRLGGISPQAKTIIDETPTVPTTPERIPIHPAALEPIWVGDGYASVTGQVVADDFVLLVATLPNGYRVAGVSGACTTDAAHPTCPNLALFALYDLRLRIDLALRAKAFGAWP